MTSRANEAAVLWRALLVLVCFSTGLSMAELGPALADVPTAGTELDLVLLLC